MTRKVESWARELAGKISDHERRLTGVETKPQLAYSSIEDGSLDENDADGQLVGVIGKQFDGTHTITSLNGPVPPIPSQPVVSQDAVSLIVSWDGTYLNRGGVQDIAVPAPMDFSRVEVHASQDPNFTADLSGTLADTIETPRGTSVYLALNEGTWYVRLRTRTLSGKLSAPSTRSEGTTVLPVTNVDLDALKDVFDQDMAQLETELGQNTTAITAAKGRLDTAETTLNTTFPARFTAVEGTASGAATAASTAQSTADTAGTTATTAKQTADAANAEAARLAGITGRVIYQVSAPTGANATQNNLWIRSSDNKPHRWNPDSGLSNKWEAVTDQAAVDAAAAAATAQTKANKAETDAATAQTKANQAHTLAGTAEGNAQEAITAAGSALSTAQNLPKVLHGTGAPAGTAPDGSIWWQHKDSLQGAVIAQWNRVAGQWVSTPIDSQAIANLDVGKLTAGSADIPEIVSKKIAAFTGQFINADIGNLVVTNGAHFATAVMDTAFADMFSSRRLNSTQVYIGPPGNLIANGMGDVGDNSGWASPLTYDTTDKPAEVKGSFRSAPASDTITPGENRFPVTPGSEYLFEIWMKADKPNSRIFIELRDQTNTLNSSSVPVSNADGTFKPHAGRARHPVDNHPVPTTWTKYYGILTARSNATSLTVQRVYFNHPNGTERTATIWLAGLSLRERITPSLVVEGIIDGQRVIGAQIETDAAANTGIKMVDSQLVAYRNSTGEESFRVDGENALMRNSDGVGNSSEVSGQGVRVFSTDTQGEIRESVRLGTFGADDYISLTDDAGETAVSLDKMGGITGRTIDAAESLTLAGNDIGEQLASIPQALVAWGQVPINEATMRLNETGTEIGLFEIGWNSDVESATPRMYEFNLNNILVRSSHANTVGLRLRYTFDGTAPTINSTIVAYNYGRVAGGDFVGLDFNRLFASSNGGYLRILVSLYKAGTVATANVYAGPGSAGSIYCTVKDLGIAPEQSAQLSSGGGVQGGSGNVTPPPPPPNPKVTYKKTFFATGTRSYTGNGSTYNYNTSKMYSGQSPSGYGDLSSVAVFQSFTSMLAGATINDIWVDFYYEYWYYVSGGQAWISLHGSSSLPSSRPAFTYAASRGSWPRGAGKWVRLPDHLYAGFRSGQYRGFGLGAGGGGLSQYGYGRNPKITIRYTK